MYLMNITFAVSATTATEPNTAVELALELHQGWVVGGREYAVAGSI